MSRLSLEQSTRERSWMRARARDRRSWPTPAAWAQALLQLAANALVRARAQARIFGRGTHREFFALIESVERIAEDRFFVVQDGEAIYVTGPRRADDPRPSVIARAAGLADVGHGMLLAAADQQEKENRRRRRSHRRGLKLADNYLAAMPKVVVAPAKTRIAARPSRRPVSLFESCGDGWLIFMGAEGEPLELDNDEDYLSDRGEMFDVD